MKLMPEHLVTYKLFGQPDGPHYAHYDLVGGSVVCTSNPFFFYSFVFAIRLLVKVAVLLMCRLRTNFTPVSLSF